MGRGLGGLGARAASGAQQRPPPGLRSAAMLAAAAAAGLEEEEEEETEEEKEEAEVGTAAGARPEARLQPGMLPLPSPSVRAALSPAPREKTRPETSAPAPPPEHNHNSESKNGPVVCARPPRRLKGPPRRGPFRARAAGPEGMGEGEGSPPPRPEPAWEAGTPRALALPVSEAQAPPAVEYAELGARWEAARPLS
ncbi:unnamed protein product [Rangifer tarandus platyrhynchus]|uniref:Uncharacterized protein n=3 Tax=Rangifer tarandus platyrhynchus TaxID=3082113 RepID=A0ABN8ZVB0_RANTA|nr:unnamed protein product [Rangifer tarandus platyrhynchus]CAI9711792.1 unnamed protein product [Rangifer tarandus platyrhynchus]